MNSAKRQKLPNQFWSIFFVLLCSVVVESRFSSKSSNNIDTYGKKRSDGKCVDAERCCVGRDSSCVVHGNIFSSPCYCDEGCLETGDCCSDYQEVCNVKGRCSSNDFLTMIILSKLQIYFFDKGEIYCYFTWVH